MLTIDQVRQLESRVEKAVSKITSLLEEREQLNSENLRLRDQLSTLQNRVSELEKIVQTFKEDQGKIEQGILSALDKLSAFEDSILSQDSAFPSDGAEGGHGFSADGRNEDTIAADEGSEPPHPGNDNGQMDIF